MSLLFTDSGDKIALEALVNKTAPQNLILKLFKSNTTPAKADTAGSYTEADFTGYSNVTLTGASWGAASGSNPASIAYAQQTFTSSAGSQSQNVYGYFLVQASSGTLVYAERFSDGPYTIVNNGDTIKVTPTITGN